MSIDWDAQRKVDALQTKVSRLEKKIQTRSYLGAPSWEAEDDTDYFTRGADAFMRLKREDGSPRTTAMDYLPLLLQLKVPRSKRTGSPEHEFCYGAMAAAGIPRDQREAVWDAWMAALPPLQPVTSATQDYAIVGHRGDTNLPPPVEPLPAYEAEKQSEQRIRDTLGLPSQVVPSAGAIKRGITGRLILEGIALGLICLGMWLVAAMVMWGFHNPHTPRGAMTGHFWDFMLLRTVPEFQTAEKGQ